MAKMVTQIENVGSVELNVRIILSLDDWQKVLNVLDGQEFHRASWPFFWLRDSLREQVRTAQKTFEAETENER